MSTSFLFSNFCSISELLSSWEPWQGFEGLKGLFPGLLEEEYHRNNDFSGCWPFSSHCKLFHFYRFLKQSTLLPFSITQAWGIERANIAFQLEFLPPCIPYLWTAKHTAKRDLKYFWIFNQTEVIDVMRINKSASRGLVHLKHLFGIASCLFPECLYRFLASLRRDNANLSAN